MKSEPQQPRPLPCDGSLPHVSSSGRKRLDLLIPKNSTVLGSLVRADGPFPQITDISPIRQSGHQLNARPATHPTTLPPVLPTAASRGFKTRKESQSRAD